jgi:two-component system sensor histidine kinase DegS
MSEFSHMGFKRIRLTAIYLGALSLIALGNLAAFWIVTQVAGEFADSGPLINISGRQRMLSQKLAKEALLLAGTQNAETAKTLSLELEHTSRHWEGVHKQLLNGWGQANDDAELRSNTQTLLTAIDRHLKSARDQVLAIRRLGPEERAALDSGSEPIRIILTACDFFLRDMDRAVSIYEKQAQLRVARMKSTETAILVAALALLLLEALLIFRPMFHRIARSFEELQRLNKQLNREIAVREHEEQARRKAEAEREVLRGLVPICANCKKIRDPQGQWQPLETYIEKRSEAQFSHGLCDCCRYELYPDSATAQRNC